MATDDQSLDALIEESQDLQSDAMSTTAASLDELVDLGRERRAHGDIDPEEGPEAARLHHNVTRRTLLAGGAVAAAAFGPVLLGLSASPAFAASGTDVQMLQTSASIEALAVATYATALTLPYIGGAAANATIKAFATETKSQHEQHLQAFNAATTALGGKAQTSPDPKYAPIVKSAVATITGQTAAAGALSVVGLAITLENVAAETYVAFCSKYSATNAKKVTASIMGVEAQHVATLLAVQALLNAGASNLITLSPTVAAKLPAAAGSIGFPNSFYKTSSASPATEGAVS